MQHHLVRGLGYLAALVAMLVAAVSLVGSADASPLRVIGSGHSSGDFAVTAANADAKHASALYLRGYGRGLSSFAVVGCSRGFSVGSKATTLSHMTSGRLYRLRMPFSGDCTVTASLSGSGSIRLQVLR